MLGFNSGRFRSVNADQLATPTDRMLVGRVERPIARGSVPVIDQETGEIIRYVKIGPRERPNLLEGTFVFAIGMVIGIVVVAWPL
jgi:hypothetical protein